MVSLFSIFDPVSMMNLSWNWLSLTLLWLYLVKSFWISSSRSESVLKMLYNYICSEFLPLSKKSSMNIIFMFSLFIFIMYNNVCGLMSYVFTGSSHLVFSLSFGMSIWLSVVLYGWLNNNSNLLIHLIPQGTPWFLMPFMVVIEMISNIIRPITLSVRLAANMIAGHLLLVLLSSSMIESGGIIFDNLVSMSGFMLGLLELAVAFIQAYVFGVLCTLYMAESVD